MQRTHSLQQRRQCLLPAQLCHKFSICSPSLGESNNHSFTIHLLARSFIHAFIRAFIHSFIHSFIYSFVRQFSLCHSALALISCQCLFRFLLKWKVNIRDWMVTGGGTDNWLKSLRFCMLAAKKLKMTLLIVAALTVMFIEGQEKRTVHLSALSTCRPVQLLDINNVLEQS